MLRYLCQLDDYSCAPIAIMNLHKWRGLSATRKDFHRYMRLCGCTYPDGTSRGNLSKALGKRSRKVTYPEFKRIIGKGSAILSTHIPGEAGHTWFCPGIATRSGNNKKGFLAVNYSSEGVILISWQRMRSLLRYCVVWNFQ